MSESLTKDIACEIYDQTVFIMQEAGQSNSREKQSSKCSEIHYLVVQTSVIYLWWILWVVNAKGLQVSS